MENRSRSDAIAAFFRRRAIVALAAFCPMAACAERAPAGNAPDAAIGEGNDAARSDGPQLSTTELMDPETCRDCHPAQYRGWAGSMHAYASRDPVFLAMNARGQRETGGDLSDFCVQCHAPMALRLGLTEDGTNLSDLPDAVQGVTCFFCHSVEAVVGHENNGLAIASDGVLRASISDPLKSPHSSAYSPLHDGALAQSSDLCGACHDVVLPNGIELERTYRQWQGSVFGPDGAGAAASALTCSGCHMPRETPAGASDDRPGHSHHMAAVDVALTPFPETGDAELDRHLAEEQLGMVTRALDASLGIEICVQQLSGLTAALFVTLENAGAGHNFPSGAAQDRRVWVEITAYAAGDPEPIYTSGVVPDGQPVAELDDPDLWLLRDAAFKQDEEPAHMFWEIARLQEETLLPALTTVESSPDFIANHATRRFPRDAEATIPGVIERVRVRVRLRPIGLEVLDDLIASGDLDPAVRGRMPTFDIIPNRHLEGHAELSGLASATLEWSQATRTNTFNHKIVNDGAFAKDCVGTF